MLTFYPTAAYWSQETVDSLLPISEIPGVGDVSVPTGWFKSARAAKTRKLDPQGESIQTTFAVIKPSGSTQPAPRPFGNTPAGCPPYENLHVFPSALNVDSPKLRYKDDLEADNYVISPAQNRYPYGTPYRSVSPSPSQSSFSSSEYSSPSSNQYYYSTERHQYGSSIQLVPLNVLENSTYTPRDPVDERLLERLSHLAPLRPTVAELRSMPSSSRSFS